MFTKDQEKYLQDLADKGLAEEDEAKSRNEEIKKESEIKEARDKKLAELEKQAKELIETGLKEFDESIK